MVQLTDSQIQRDRIFVENLNMVKMRGNTQGT